jgi:hypothetical protein
MQRSDERVTQDVQSEPGVKRKRRWPVVAAMGIALAAAAYALVPAPAASSAPPVPELMTLAAPQAPAVVAPPPPQVVVAPARIVAPPARHSRSRAPIRRAGETLD